MRRMTVAIFVGALCVAGRGRSPDLSAAMDAIKTRQAALNLSGVAMGAMKAAIDGGGSVRTQSSTPAPWPAGPTPCRAPSWPARASTPTRA